MTARLHPADVEAIARRVVELMRAEPRDSAPVLIDAAEVARRFGISRDFVYEHRAELGAVPLGDGARPRLRFDPERVAAALSSRERGRGHEGEESSAPAPVPRRRRAAESDNEAGILPIFALNSPASDKSAPQRANARGQATRSEPRRADEPTGRRVAGRTPPAENERRP